MPVRTLVLRRWLLGIIIALIVLASALARPVVCIGPWYCKHYTRIGPRYVCVAWTKVCPGGGR
jgi:hypothetical protein